MSYRFHPYADLFPLMSSEEFDRLVADIDANGQRTPIDIYNETILDGRNRYNVCLKLKIVPKTRPCFTDSPLDFVLSANLSRRHLNESQRAMVAAKLREMSKTPKVLAHLEEPVLQTKDLDAHLQICSTELSIPDVSKVLNVSPRSIANANTVLAKGTAEQIKAIENGNQSVSAAAKELKLVRILTRKQRLARYRKIVLEGIALNLDEFDNSLRLPDWHDLLDSIDSYKGR